MLLDQVEKWKSRFGPPGDGQLERLLAAAARRRFRDAASLIRLHETALFLRAYPRSPEVARLADAILFSFAKRIAELQPAGADLSAFEEPEISGIAGTSLSAVFSYEVARRLAARHPRNLEIGWDRYDGIDRLGPVLRRFLPLLGEDWPVEAHVPYRQWISAARPRGASDLAWLLERLAGSPELFDTLDLPLTWHVGDTRTSRSRLRLAGRELYCHREPLLRRSDISLARELDGPPLPVRRLARPEARKILDLILDTSAMRFRELYGFSHPDEGGVYHADAGRGVEIFFFGVPPEWRLPLRAYHGGMFFKNGVPAGYVEVLSLFERAEVGFNLYYTFREGESAWLYARLLRLFRQVLGVTCFSVDPYQIGLENPEAVDSGAFWFYRKLGFRPVDPKVAALMEREESRMKKTPGYRSSKRTLEKLAEGYILLEAPSCQKGAWDKFRVRNLGLAAERARAGTGSSSGLLPRPSDLFVGRASGCARTSCPAPTPTFVGARGYPLGPSPPSRMLPHGQERNLAVTALAQVVRLIPDLAGWTAEEKTAAAKVLRAKESASEARYLRLMQRHPRLRAAFLALGSR